MTKEKLIKSGLAATVFIFLLITYIDSYKINKRNEQLEIEREKIRAETRELELGTKMTADTYTEETPTSKPKLRTLGDNGPSYAVQSMYRIRFSAENYLGTNGRWPETMTELGFKPDTTTSPALQGIKIDKGDVYGFLTPKYGRNKMIRLYHTIDHNPFGWKCSTNLKLEGPTYLGRMTCEEAPDLSFTGTYFQ